MLHTRNSVEAAQKAQISAFLEDEKQHRTQRKAIIDALGYQVKPRLEDFAQLSSTGHGRIKEVVGEVVVYEAWFRNWKLHGESGAALIVRDANTGVTTKECWIKDGKLHRETAPAWIERDAQTGVATREGWFLGDKRDRLDGPAHVERDSKTGKVAAEVWFADDTEISPAGRLTLRAARAFDRAYNRFMAG